MSTRRLSLMLLEEGACSDQCVPLTKLLAFVPLYFVLQGQIFQLLQVSFDFLFLHSNPLWGKGCPFFLCFFFNHLVFGVSSRRSCRFSQNWSTSTSPTSVIWAKTWIAVMLNGLLWKVNKIFLSFLRLHTSTTFWILLLTMRATPFLLRDIY